MRTTQTSNHVVRSRPSDVSIPTTATALLATLDNTFNHRLSVRARGGRAGRGAHRDTTMRVVVPNLGITLRVRRRSGTAL